MPEKISLSRITSILFLFFFTTIILSLFFIAAMGNINYEIFYVSTFIGILVSKELIDEFTPDHLKMKLNIFISGLFIVFLLIVINEIIYLLST